jgi:hypothetical protein
VIDTQCARLLLAASGWIALAAVFVPVGFIPCFALVFCFVMYCPGAALIALRGSRDPLEELLLSVAAATLVAIVVIETLTRMHAWSATRAMVLLAAITTVASLFSALRSQQIRHTAPETARVAAVRTSPGFPHSPFLFTREGQDPCS